jgi:hypothetical protein
LHRVAFQAAMADALRKDAPREAFKVQHCGKTQYGRFARERGPIDEPILLSCDQAHVKPIRQRCDSRLCPRCTVKLAQLRKKTAFRYVKRARQKKLRVAHLVLTEPNTKKLGSLRELMAKVTKWKNRVRVKHNLAGISANLEVIWHPPVYEGGRLKSGGWHPHVHCIVALRPEKERKKLPHGLWDYGELERQLTMEWHDLTGCSRACVVKRRSFKDASRGCKAGGSLKLEEVVDPGGDSGGKIAIEVAKYITKIDTHWQGAEGERTLNPGLADLANGIKGLQLGRAYGIFHNHAMGPDPDEGWEPDECDLCKHANREFRQQQRPHQWHDTALRYRGPPSWLRHLAYEGLCELASDCLDDLVARFPEYAALADGDPPE